MRRFLILVALSAILLSGCVVIPPKDNTSFKGEPITASGETSLAKRLDAVTAERPGQTGIFLLPSGKDAFLARIAMIELAEESIVAQYYIFEDDITGRIFLARLLAAAERGVKVRLLVDDLAKTWKDRYLAAAVTHPNFEMSLFNPPVRFGSVRPVKATARLTRIHRRMHNKEMVVDGRIAIIGGRNIGDGYFGATDEPIADLDALVIGDEVSELLRIFNDYWEYPLSVPVESVAKKKWQKEDKVRQYRAELLNLNLSEEAMAYVNELLESPLFAAIEEKRIPFIWGTAQTFADEPEKLSYSRNKKDTHLAIHLQEFLDRCQSELILISPYFIPQEGGVETLTGLADRGVNIAIVTNGIGSSDHSMVHSAYAKYRKELLAHGISLFETRENPISDTHSWSLLHVKLFVLDRRYVMIGSYNLDPRSNKLNTELLMVVDSPELADFVVDKAKLAFDGKLWHLNLAEKGKIEWAEPSDESEVEPLEPGTTWFHRQKLKLLSLLPIEDQL